MPSGFGVEWSAYHTLTSLVTSRKYCLSVPFGRGRDSWGVQSVIHTISPEKFLHIRLHIIRECWLLSLFYVSFNQPMLENDECFLCAQITTVVVVVVVSPRGSGWALLSPGQGT